jgi:hypothetical protein
MRSAALKSSQILLTRRGTDWLAQFEYADREDASRLVESLTLISHSEFERALGEQILSFAATLDGPVSLYAVREIDPQKSCFEQTALDLSDLGSEARVAAMIRNIVKTDRKKFLSHPSVDEMRTAKCRTVIVVDDFIGSGERTSKFLHAIWQDSSIRSWHSLKYIRFAVVVYSATEKGLSRVRRIKCRPQVNIVRACPTYRQMPWSRALRDAIIKLCKKYATRTSRPRMALGYEGTMAALVFEHGCPNNAPAVLLAPPNDKKPWTPLFPDRSVLPAEASAFPPEIVRRDPVSVLLDVGQTQLALSGALSRRGEVGETVLVVLALVAKGVRKASALGYATGLTSKDCSRILERCVKWQFLTRSHRVTPRGLAELHYARQISPPASIPPRGEEDYYPKKLRRATGG